MYKMLKKENFKIWGKKKKENAELLRKKSKVLNIQMDKEENDEREKNKHKWKNIFKK